MNSQIEAERKVIEQAPPVTPGPNVERCHWCGAPAKALLLIEIVNGEPRYKGTCCNGHTNRK